MSLPFGFEEGLHHFLALGAREVAGLRADDLVARIGGDDLLEALLAVVGRRRADRSLQLDDVDVAGLPRSLRLSSSQRPALAAFLDEVRAHERDVQRLVGRSTARSVMITGIFAAFASRSTVSQPVSTTGENAMTSTLLRDERAHRLDLVFLLLLGIGNLQVDAALLGLQDLLASPSPRCAIPIRRRSARSRSPSCRLSTGRSSRRACTKRASRSGRRFSSGVLPGGVPCPGNWYYQSSRESKGRVGCARF